jgi:hypothetical protein
MAGPSQPGTSNLTEFETKFRRAVLEMDVEWIVAAMDPEGWTCGDAFMSASAYGAAFRHGDMDHALLFEGEKWRKQVGVPDELSYREWFSRCPNAYAVEAADDSRPDPGRAYMVHWRGPGCPEKGPAIRIIQRPTKVSIRVFGGCI